MIVRDATAVALMDDARTVLRDASITIEGPAIRAIGGGSADRTIDARGKLVLPGFVNTHHHLFQTLTRAVPAVQNAELFEWLTTLYGIWRGIDAEAVHVAAQVGLGELLLSGCTTSSDHHYLSVPVDETIRAAADLGIRFHPTRGSMSLGRSKGGLPPDELCEDESAIMADCERVIATYHDPKPLSMCRVGLAPCAPFNVSQTLMKHTAALAKQRRVRMHTHLAETLDEEQYCLKHHGVRPIEYLEQCGWMRGDAWLAHMVHPSDDEIARLARAGVGVAHCPTSNRRLRSGRAPVPKMLDAGVRVGLGVDGSASNDSSDMLAEVREAFLSHREEWLSSGDALWMATRGGAAVLGRDDIGQIAPGKAADLVLLDLDGLGTAGALHDPVAAAVYCRPRVDTVIVNGRVVVEHGVLQTADARAISRRANEISARLVGGTCQE